jgi:hypothetical protein
MPTKGDDPSKTPWQHTFASQMAGAVSTVAFFPIDMLKIRYMSQDGTVHRQHNAQTYRSILNSLKVILQQEGLYTLFRGSHVAVTAAVVAWGVYMYVYRTLLLVAPQRENLSFARLTVCSAIASSVSAICSGPIWLIKTRMQLEERSNDLVQNYRTMRHGAMHVVRTSGVRGLFRGVHVQVFLGLPNALNLPIYDTLKAAHLRRTGKRSLDLPEVCFYSTVTKVCLAVVSQPIVLVKTRLQDVRYNHGNIRYNNALQTVRTIMLREGVHGMFRGIGPSLLQTVPRSVTQFVAYEFFLGVL